MSDNDPSSGDPLGPIADEFVEAFRQGKRPSVEEFARRYPEHAAEIRDMLPALVLMEKAKSADEPEQRCQARTSAAAHRTYAVPCASAMIRSVSGCASTGFPFAWARQSRGSPFPN